ncbi:hypothetical protein BKA61DRAFT_666739 [Leptodontidium sp. MPI-SDFR-AT-0119]|nr:hypothetical protein BKA61DRAFT_666739 [Leptodontidium sp. MPI-SDFR-AT-0119]
MSSETDGPSGDAASQQPDLWAKALRKLPAKDGALITEAARNCSCSCQDLLDQLQKLAAEKQALAVAKGLKVRFRGREYKLRAVAGNIAAWLRRYQGIGDVAVSFDPVHAALPWAVVRFVIQAVAAENELYNHLLVGMEMVSHLILRGGIYESLYLRGRDTSLQHMAELSTFSCIESALVDLYSEILSFLAHSMSFLEKATAKRAAYAIFHPDAFEAYGSKLQALERRAEISLRNTEEIVNAPVIRTDLRVAHLWQIAEARERCKILQWISTIHYETDHYNARKGRLGGTGDWLLARSQYLEWRDSPASMILWLHGIPGAGKTKLSTKVVDDVYQRLDDPQNEEGLAYFYCDANRSSHRKPLAILRSFVKQLSAPLSSSDDRRIMPVVAEMYRSKRARGFPSDGLTFEESESALLELVNSYPQVTLVVDGLDECDHETRQELMVAMEKLRLADSGLLKIFLASRNDTDLADAYQGGYHIEVCSDDNKNDIETFVEFKLSGNKWCQKYLLSSVRRNIIDMFKRKGRGMFQWAAIHIDELLSLRNNSDIQVYLDDLPEGLKNAYDKVWQTIQGKRGRAKVIAQRTFQWLMCSWQPLTPQMLEFAVCQDPETGFTLKTDVTIDYIVNICQNLIKIEDEYGSNYCHFSHLSVQEYFQTHHWSVKTAHRVVGRVCLGVWMSSLQISHRLNRDYAFWPEEERFSDIIGSNAIEQIEDKCLAAHEEEDKADKWTKPISPDVETEYSNWLLDRAVRRRDQRKHAGGIIPTYAAGWFIHFRALNSELHHIAVPEVLREFLGNPGNSSPYYRKWCEWITRDAALSGNQAFCPELLGWDNKIEARCRPHSSPEAVCVYVGLQAVVSDWLERDAVHVTARNELGETLLSLAARTGNLPLCKQLLQKGGEVNPKPESAYSPLPAAAEYGHREVAQLLIQHQARINTGGDFYAPIMQGRVLRDVEFVRLLLENGADPNIVRGRQFALASPLISAVSWRYLDVVRLLLERNADINLTVDGPFHTALCAATGWDYPKPKPDDAIIKFLIQAGAELDVVGGQFGTALGAAFCGEFYSEARRTDPVELLLSAGARFRPEDYKGPNISLCNPIGEPCSLYDLYCKVETYFDCRWIEWDDELDNGEATSLPSS